MANIDPVSAQLIRWRGTIALMSPQLNHCRHEFAPELGVATTPMHITLLTREEYQSMGKPNLPTINLSHVYILGKGSGSSNTVRWLIVAWNHGNSWRQSVGLPWKDFHVTLTESNNHSIDKSIMTLEGGLAALLKLLDQMDEDAMDHVLALKPTPYHFLLAVQMVRRFPDTYKSYIRLGNYSINDHPKIAMHSYARALSLNPGLFQYIRKRLKNMSHRVSWGPVFSHYDLENFQSFDLKNHLTTPWRGDIMTVCSDQLWTSPVESRERLSYLEQDLPRFFSWLYPHRLAGMSTPRTESDIDLLLDIGITTILTLTEEQPLNPQWFLFKSIKNIFIGVKNYDTPTIAEMDIIFDRFQQDTDGRWLIHCGGGKGRAGTVLACLMAMYGHRSDDTDTDTPKLDSSTVIQQLRSIRPGSIESLKQEQFIGQWLSHRWRVASEARDTSVSNTPLSTLVKHGSFPRGISDHNVTICLLVGLPGSGKSWVARSIAKRRAATTIIVSQDDTRSRSACEFAFGQSYTDKALIILDRCNPDTETRKEWLSLATAKGPAIAIYFDCEKETCLKRIDQRLGHPTIRPGKGKNALDHFSELLRRPLLEEGFEAILTVSSFIAAREVVHLLGGPSTLLKFPRTPHLFDLGASTEDDLVLSIGELKGNLTVEEKIDGANMGFSLSWDGHITVQNRSHYVSASDHAQFKSLPAWLERHGEELKRVLGRDEQYPERYILYGEWVAAQHSIEYSSLPDLFLAFDLYDRETATFASRRILDRFLQGTTIAQVPVIRQTTHLLRSEIMDILQCRSDFSTERKEGVYVRTENENRTKTVGRSKVVRSDFITGNQHWTKGQLTYNRVATEFY